MLKSTSHSDWKLIQGVAFVLFMAGALAIPTLRQWPWIWIAPLVAYVLLITCLPAARQSVSWFHLGQLSVGAVTATLGLIVLTITTLLVLRHPAEAEVHSYRTFLHFHWMRGVILTGVVFTTVNATLEELVFRGVLFDAVGSQWGKWGTVTGTAMLFGLGHLHGYPPGFFGAALAAVFGFGLGVLRLWTGGLLLPIVAHMGADATIYCILVNAGGI